MMFLKKFIGLGFQIKFRNESYLLIFGYSDIFEIEI